MPLSDRRFDKDVEEFLTSHIHKNYLDIGCGAGKYGKMVKRINPQAFIVGVEVDEEYITKYKIREIYDEIKHQRVETFIRENLAFTTDVAILGDVLEHLFKSDGIDLLHFLMYRSKAIIIVFPSKFVMYDYKGHPSEAHNSIWSEEDFKTFDYHYSKKGIMNLVILKGYLSDPETVYCLD